MPGRQDPVLGGEDRDADSGGLGRAQGMGHRHGVRRTALCRRAHGSCIAKHL